MSYEYSEDDLVVVATQEVLKDLLTGMIDVDKIKIQHFNTWQSLKSYTLIQ